MHVTGLSGWMETDAAACPIHAPELVVWHVLDNYAFYYETNRNGRFTGVYDGDDVTSETLTLDAKSYTVTIGKETFGVTVYGGIDYELS